jgi:hypothetical protein
MNQKYEVFCVIEIAPQIDNIMSTCSQISNMAV